MIENKGEGRRGGGGGGGRFERYEGLEVRESIVTVRINFKKSVSS